MHICRACSTKPGPRSRGRPARTNSAAPSTTRAWRGSGSCRRLSSTSPRDTPTIGASYASCARSTPSPRRRTAWFDARAVEDELQDERIYLRVRKTADLPRGDVGRVFAGAEHGADLDVTLVHLAPGETAERPASASAEVWVVQEGKGTFFLGQRQARIVRADEFVRIPANTSWRVESTGDGPLRGVAIGAAKQR